VVRIEDLSIGGGGSAPRCVGIDPTAVAQGARAVLVACGDANYDQSWVTTAGTTSTGTAGMVLQLRRADGKTGGCLDVAGESLADATSIVVGTCTGHDSQVWYPSASTPAGLGDGHSNLVMDTASAATTLGSQIVQSWNRQDPYTPAQAPTQEWQLVHTS
jgi:hypothetical protein